jgi:hypothetical protein
VEREDTTFNGEGGRHQFSDMKVPRQYPFVLLVKVVEDEVRLS